MEEFSEVLRILATLNVPFLLWPIWTELIAAVVSNCWLDMHLFKFNY